MRYDPETGRRIPPPQVALPEHLCPPKRLIRPGQQQETKLLMSSLKPSLGKLQEETDKNLGDAQFLDDLFKQNYNAAEQERRERIEVEEALEELKEEIDANPVTRK